MKNSVEIIGRRNDQYRDKTSELEDDLMEENLYSEIPKQQEIVKIGSKNCKMIKKIRLIEVKEQLEDSTEDIKYIYKNNSIKVFKYRGKKLNIQIKQVI